MCDNDANGNLPGDRLFATEKEQYLEEIDALRSRAARVEELEFHNVEILAELECAKQRNQESSQTGAPNASGEKGASNVQNAIGLKARTVDIEEYDRVVDLLVRSEKDYEKVAFARQVLETKLRHYKDMTRQWREYTDRWIMKHPVKGIKSRRLGTSKASPEAPTTDQRFSSAPSPPSIPDDITLSISDISRDASPGADSERAWVRQGCSSTLTLEPLPNRITATQTALSNDRRASSGDLTEASDESGRRPSPSIEACNYNLTGNIGGHAEKQAENSGSSPIIVSERSLKRKRPIRLHEDGTGSKSPLVKNEQPSSSPLPTPSLRLDALHDSIDLDDIGGHIDTPRKRRRDEELRLRTSLVSPAAVGDKEMMVYDPANQRPSGIGPMKDKLSSGTVSDVYPFPANPATTHIEKAREEQPQRSRKASSKVQQQAHNKRVSERLDGVKQSSICDVNSSKLNAAKALNTNNLRHRELPTPKDYVTPAPEAHIQPRTPQDNWVMERRMAMLANTTILQPTDPNSQILPRTQGKLANQKTSFPPSRHARGAGYVPALAEDGEDGEGVPSISDQLKVNLVDVNMASDKASRAPDLHHRLGTLLSEPSPAKSVLASTGNDFSPPKTATLKTPVMRSEEYVYPKAPFTTPSMLARIKAPASGMTGKASLRQCKSVEAGMSEGANSARATDKNRATKPVSRKSSLLDQSADTRPEHEPLRARPVHRLRIEDFKLNPAHSDYAYHESVRKHDEKKAISGCTDWNCPRCRDIRKFVENSGYARSAGQDEEETDRRLLEGFLGNDQDRLKKMSAEERKEILVQARSQQFANEFGKHRTPFRRAQSPVGYWNVGFPSTQEQEQNLEAVRSREREQVKSMYWEAIREQGRYVFADE